jgi:hypothetical protein
MSQALSGWRARPGHGIVPGTTTVPNPYRGFGLSAEVIEHAVWLYHCFSLSLRDVETILAASGVVVSYESIREWSLRFGWLFANQVRRRLPVAGRRGGHRRCVTNTVPKLEPWGCMRDEGGALDAGSQVRALTLVPSVQTVPTRSSPMCRAMSRMPTKAASKAVRFCRRNAAMVSWSGRAFAITNRTPRPRCVACSIRRDENRPLA